MSRYLVKNKAGTAGQVPPFPYQNLSWLEYWKEKTGNNVNFCTVCGCFNKAEHGGHVQRCDTLFDTRIYIVPLCAECNNPKNKEVFYVDCELCSAS